jgi:branched-subunit amino acid aminotransferase/4-amino-4-deoxychorismate lyase
MHKSVSYNHQIIPFSEINLPGISSAALYGKGVFTTLAIYESNPFMWRKHWFRLNNHAAELGIDLDNFKEEAVFESLLNLISENEASDARARLTFFDTSEPIVWSVDGVPNTSLLIQTAELRQITDELNLGVSPFSINSNSFLANIKSCNYLDNILAFEDSKQHGFDEAIRLNQRGEITSACLANVFWFNGEKLFTPHLNTGCIAGTTRELVAEIAKEIGVDYFETIANLNEILSADEVFLTSSGLSIASVGCVEEVKFDRVSTKIFQRKLNDLKRI